jgi:hypothetical protein
VTIDEFRVATNELWGRFDREGRELKDSWVTLDRLHEWYRRLDPTQRSLANAVLTEWVLSENEAKRFDAVALIREFRVIAAIATLHELSLRLGRSTDPGAPFERQKVVSLVGELSRS